MYYGISVVLYTIVFFHFRPLLYF